ncbi:DUF982 domain-containing protein [Devosia sp. PTR5]|uniref:DUF982 domain-containing protein n=1 Tax=Devosia oryzisoli TaxID=2774138 RepID=A0A927FTD4_9HYPH|nr:DUF982 domain-containing protein [Devosia oryzisoli]
MGLRNFASPVTLKSNVKSTRTFRVNNAADALDYLERFWRGARTREYRRAYAVCQSAVENLASAEAARGYLVAAAEGAGLLYRRSGHSQHAQ